VCQVEALHSISTEGSGDCPYLKHHIESVVLVEVKTALHHNWVGYVDCNRHQCKFHHLKMMRKAVQKKKRVTNLMGTQHEKGQVLLELL